MARRRGARENDRPFTCAGVTEMLLPYGRQTIEDDDIAAVSAALKSDFLTGGPLVDQYEAAFAAATGAKHAVACNSGTAALHLAVLGLGIKPGDAVIVPTLTFLATANVVRMAGAEVVFADVDFETGLLTPETFEAAITAAKKNNFRVRAAIPVHLNGQICDLAALSQIARKHQIALIEDACHALGEHNVGAAEHSIAACFSTHPVKAIATGEGGVVTTGDDDFAIRLRHLRNHGMTRDQAEFENKDLAFVNGVPNPWYYEMHEIGWNYRLPDLLCALGISQLAKLDRFVTRRKQIATQYERLLGPLSPAIRPVSRANAVHGWHLYVIRIDFEALGTTRAQFMKALRDEGIGTQVHYVPVHTQPYYRQRYGEIALPGAAAYYERCLSIPMFPSMNDSDVERVVAALSRVAGRAC
jgi:UDP-4-amino-4,6-dideoxy-N-acetyl-beta-L-altrosamine transaminase